MHATLSQGLSKYISDLVMKMHTYSTTLAALYDSWRKCMFILKTIWVHLVMHTPFIHKS